MQHMTKPYYPPRMVDYHVPISYFFSFQNFSVYGPLAWHVELSGWLEPHPSVNRRSKHCRTCHTRKGWKYTGIYYIIYNVALEITPLQQRGHSRTFKDIRPRKIIFASGQRKTDFWPRRPAFFFYWQIWGTMWYFGGMEGVTSFNGLEGMLFGAHRLQWRWFKVYVVISR